MVDLGSWIGEGYRIPEENSEDSGAPQSDEPEVPETARPPKATNATKKILH